MIKQDFTSVKRLLKMQNPPIDTSDWTAWKEEEQELGTFYHVSVNVDDIGLIDKKGSRLFFCFSKIKITLPKQLKGEVANSGNEDDNDDVDLNLNKVRIQ